MEINNKNNSNTIINNHVTINENPELTVMIKELLIALNRIVDLHEKSLRERDNRKH